MPVPSLYDANVKLDAKTGAFTLMVTTGVKETKLGKIAVGGHAMMAFEWIGKGDKGHRHDIYHLHTLHSGDSSGRSSNLIYSTAVVNKVVRGKVVSETEGTRFFNKQIGLRGKRRQAVEEVFENINKNYMDDVEAAKSKFFRRGKTEGIQESRTVTIKVPKKDLKYGVMTCRLLIMGEEVDFIKTKKISVLLGQSGLIPKATNCVRFAKDISTLMGVRWTGEMSFLALFSTYQAIKSKMVYYEAVTGKKESKQRQQIEKTWKELKAEMKRKRNWTEASFQLISGPGMMGDDFSVGGKKIIKLIESGKAKDKDAGHGKQSKMLLQVGGNILPKVFRKKPCTGVEAYSYTRLTKSRLSEFLPNLVGVEVDNKMHFFYEDREEKSFRDVIWPLTGVKKLAQKKCHIVIEDISYSLAVEWSCDVKDIDVIDIKIGSKIYLNGELKLNGHKKKKVTKDWQDFTVWVSKLGGSQGIMVAKDKGLWRALGYSQSKDRVRKFFKELNQESRLQVLKQLSQLYNYMFDDGELDNNVFFVGASVFVLKQKRRQDRFKVKFIDLDHAIFKDRAEQMGLHTLFWQAQGNFMTGLGDLMRTISDLN